MTHETQVDAVVDGRHYVLELNTEQLAVRGPGDLITAEIVDVEPLPMKSCS